MLTLSRTQVGTKRLHVEVLETRVFIIAASGAEIEMTEWEVNLREAPPAALLHSLDEQFDPRRVA